MNDRFGAPTPPKILRPGEPARTPEAQQVGQFQVAPIALVNVDGARLVLIGPDGVQGRAVALPRGGLVCVVPDGYAIASALGMLPKVTLIDRDGAVREPSEGGGV